MARQLNDTGDKVVSIHKRGPKAQTTGKAKQAQAAAAKADAMLGAPSRAEAANRGAPTPETEPNPSADIQDTSRPETAPSFGANEPDAGVFLREVQKIRRQMEEVEKVKLELKTSKGKLKDIRKLAAGAGLVMREVDESIEALNTEHVDLIAREERRRLYFAWLGLPIGAQTEIQGLPKATDTEVEQNRWRKRGDIAGRLAEMRAVPEGCPGHCIQAFLEGWDAGHTVFMQGSPLTAGAFNADGSLKSAAELKPQADDDGKLVAFTEAHFVAGTDLDDANLRTLMPGHHEAFHNAETVTAKFGGMVRILKEKNGDGSTYVDTGEDDAEITEPVPVAPSAAEFA